MSPLSSAAQQTLVEIARNFSNPTHCLSMFYIIDLSIYQLIVYLRLSMFYIIDLSIYQFIVYSYQMQSLWIWRFPQGLCCL